MHCMKCGKESDEGAVFCESCLDTMKQYPVKPGTPVILPHRTESTAVKKVPPRRKQLSTEEKLTKSRRVIQVLSTILAIALLLLFFAVYFLYHTLSADTPEENIGQNYNTVAAEDA